MQVVVVEDEKRLAELIAIYLIEAGHTADSFHRAETAMDAVRDPDVDAVVLDVMLPGLSGLELCRRLRGEGSDVPILLLTARGAVTERVAGLDAGADDYLVKPFALEELEARLRAIRRRRDEPSDRIRVGDLMLDTAQRRVWHSDQEVELSRREFAVLQVLMENSGRVVSRGYILDNVWDGEIGIRSNAIDVHISRLRSRIDKPFGTVTITTLRGVGYRLERKT